MGRLNRIIVICSMLISSSVSAQESSPNIVLIITDQHAGNVLTQMGYPFINTPGIDKIAEEGITFTRSYCTNPVCTSSRKSFWTGKMPSQLNDITKHASIGGAMINAGYQTAYFGKWHVGQTKMDELEDWHGFQTYIDSRRDSDIVGWSTDFLKKEHNKPFFMVTSFLNPHDACELARNISGANDRYRDGPVEERMDTAFCPPLPYNFQIPVNEAEGFYGRRNQDPGDRHYHAHPTKLWTEVEWRQYMYGYDRLVEKVDAHVETLYDELERQGLLENTVVIYTSDHGDGHAAHQWNQKKTFYEESISVPFIVSWKGSTKANVIDDETLISNGLDLFPTILGLAGQPIPEYLKGVNLQPLIMLDSEENATIQREFIVAELSQRIDIGFTPGSWESRMLVTKKMKYILFEEGVNREQLFDLEIDPGELNPVTDDPEYAEELQSCREHLTEWCADIGDEFPLDNIVEDYEANSLLNAILINDDAIEGFNPNVYDYSIDTITENQAIINVTPVHSGANITTDPFKDILGDSASRSASILVISEDGVNASKYYLQIEGWENYTITPAEQNKQFRVILDSTTQKIHMDQDNEEINTVRIFGSSGNLLLSMSPNTVNPIIDISHFTPGVYLLNAETSQGIINHIFVKSN